MIPGTFRRLVTYNLGGDVFEIGDADLRRISQDLALQDLDELGNSIKTIDIGVHEPARGVSQFWNT
jgi:hypothetical protein